MLGSGVMGLSTARLAQDAGFPVAIYTAALPPDTTSNIAGGQFHPFGLFRDDAVTPEFRAQFARALDYSWRRFQIMVGEDYGIRWLPTYVETDSPDAKTIATFPPINRMLRHAEHPFPWASTLRYDTLYVETGRYLRQMIRDVQVAAGKIEVRRTVCGHCSVGCLHIRPVIDLRRLLGIDGAESGAADVKLQSGNDHGW